MENQKIVVKEVTGLEEKSSQEIEQALLAKHEEKFSVKDESTTSDEPVVVNEIKEEAKAETQEAPSSELKDEDVLSYIKSRYDKDINSVDELFETKESNETLPEDVAAYFKYKKETGRGIEDFVKLQKDFEDMDSDQVLTAFYSSTEEGLDAIDIQDIIEDKFS